ncbi:MAG: hypothetical protein H7834_16130 [Magnetococcus sp. YQC-9]
MRWHHPWIRKGGQALIVCGVGLVFYWGVAGYQAPHPREPTPEAKQAQTRPAHEVSGPVLTEMRGDRVIRSFSAREFAARRRSFMAFQVKGVEDAVFQDARLTIHRYTDNQERLPDSLSEEVSSLLKGVISKPGTGEAAMIGTLPRVMNLIFEPVTLEIYLDKVVVLRLVAGSARIGKDRERIEFRQAALENPVALQKITSSRIDWSEESRAFEIPGEYRAETPRGQAVSSGLRVGLDFSFSSLSGGVSSNR